MGGGLPLVAREELRAGLAVPGAVGIPGQATAGAVGTIQFTALQCHLGHAHLTGHKQLLLHIAEEEKKEFNNFPPSIVVENDGSDYK